MHEFSLKGGLVFKRGTRDGKICFQLRVSERGTRKIARHLLPSRCPLVRWAALVTSVKALSPGLAVSQKLAAWLALLEEVQITFVKTSKGKFAYFQRKKCRIRRLYEKSKKSQYLR